MRGHIYSILKVKTRNARFYTLFHSFDLKTFSILRIILLSTIRKDLIRSWVFSLFLFHFLHTVYFICRKVSLIVEIKRFDQFTLARSSPFLNFIEGHL